MTEKPKNAFRVHFECTNCGDVFTKEYPKGYVVTSNTFRGYHSKKGDIGQDDFNVISCPVCESDDHIVTKKREPISG